MFNKNFYPTPQNLISDMWFRIINKTGRILEPSAGKGDILDYINKRDYGWNTTKPKLFAIELEPELSSILISKGYNVIADDFLSFNTYSRYDVIIMNPPFDNGEKHLLKAIEIMKNGGEVVCLLNAETLKNPFSNDRKMLTKKLEELKADIVYRENAFAKAERKTNIEIAIVYIRIIANPLESDIFKDIVFETEQRHEEKETAKSDVIKYEHSEIKRLVQDYETEVELFRLAYNANEAYNSFAKQRGNSSDATVVTKKYNSGSFEYYDFINEIRRKYWQIVIKTKTMEKYITNSVREKLYEIVETQSEVEFNEKNILRIKQVLLSFFVQNLEQSAISVFDDMIKYAQNDYSGNVHYYTGWKTNKASRINKKVIRPHFSNHSEFIPELEKVLNYFDGFKPYEASPLKYDVWGTRAGVYEGDYIKVQIFKKGTAHIWFSRVDLLDQLNAFVGKKRNWLPDETASKAERTKYNKEVYQHYEPTVDIGAEINTSGVMLLN